MTAGLAARKPATGYGLGVGWWLGPLTQVGRGDRFDAFFFDMQGLVPVGYTLFAVALGVFAGTVWPKVLPAMAGTLVGFLGLRTALAMLARPRYLPAETLTFPVMGTAVAPNATAGDRFWLFQGIETGIFLALAALLLYLAIRRIRRIA
ncbi:hypothetical protein ACFP2T_30250 [Plantactinospora solaniradicis]|uniref:Uncharacterized protein n=1 Tax=Plantactinospora solaniradicis TaxID=1723736 RepID=A0ABW1KHK1_9ACTN